MVAKKTIFFGKDCRRASIVHIYVLAIPSPASTGRSLYRVSLSPTQNKEHPLVTDTLK